MNKKNKLKLLGVWAFLCLLAGAAVQAQAQNSCDIKATRLETELSHARAAGNEYRVRGLERALENVHHYCQTGGYQDGRGEQALNSQASSEDLTGCDRKKAELERELAYARQYGNKYRIEGLERALSNVNRYCSDDQLVADLRDDIDDKIEDVSKLERELAQAIARGDSRRMAEKESKLAIALEELIDLQLEYERYSGR